MSTEKHGCSAYVMDNYREYPCARVAKHNEDGKWFCGTHLPSRVLERSKAREDAWTAKWDKRVIESRSVEVLKHVREILYSAGCAQMDGCRTTLNDTRIVDELLAYLNGQETK